MRFVNLFKKNSLCEKEWSMKSELIFLCVVKSHKTQ